MVDKRFYKNKSSLTLRDIVDLLPVKFDQNLAVDSSIANNPIDCVISGVNTINEANNSEITFLSNPKYAKELANTGAAACIIESQYVSFLPKNDDSATPATAALITENPYYVYSLLIDLLYQPISDGLNNINQINQGVHPKAIIGDNVKIGDNCQIAANVIIGDNAKIGDNCRISANSVIGQGVEIGDNSVIATNCTISYAILGNDDYIHDGVRLGQDGFGFATHQGKHYRLQHLGIVQIDDFVNIGANSTIDRGSSSDTIIGEGTQIDNLVQIGHNVKIGKYCIIVSQVGIAGSTILGDYVICGGQVGIAGHLTIGSFSKIAAQSGIAKNLPENSEVGGSPAVPIMQYHRQSVALKKMTKR